MNNKPFPHKKHSLYQVALLGYGLPLLLLLLGILMNLTGLDLALAEKIAAVEGGRFYWQNSYTLTIIFHEGGRNLIAVLFAMLVLTLITSFLLPTWRIYRRPMTFLLVAAASSMLLIAGFKDITTLPCPWSLTEFGGQQPWTNLTQLFSMSLPLQHCFPSGHAAGGYAWIALGFLFPLGSQRFWLGLIPGILLGLIFGIAQQLRGAHFISHDLVTLAICWWTAFVISQWMNLHEVSFAEI